MSFESQLHKERRDQTIWFRALTWPLEKAYRELNQWHARLYDHEKKERLRLEEPVISVGNITVGGTGKSPVVISLCSYLRAQGLLPGILTRGYGTKIASPGWMAVQGQQTLFGNGPVPDEAAMQAAMLGDIPVIVGADRGFAARSYLELAAKKPDIWVMDDGFQHRRLFRDLDLVCVDDRKRFGNRRVLPAGPLREPAEALSRAQGILLTRSAVTGPAQDFVSSDKVIPSFHLAFHLPEPVALASFYGVLSSDDPVIPTKWAVVCGIAQPERFVQDLQNKGRNVSATLFFRDHQNLDAPRCQKWIHTLPQDGSVGLLTTAKDAFRNKEMFKSLSLPVYVQPLVIADADKVWSPLLPDFTKT